jgi:hypothetical protein
VPARLRQGHPEDLAAVTTELEIIFVNAAVCEKIKGSPRILPSGRPPEQAITLRFRLAGIMVRRRLSASNTSISAKTGQRGRKGARLS